MRLTLASILVLSVSLSAQTPQLAPRIVGQVVGAHLQFDQATKSTTETVTLTFNHSDDTPVATVEFVVRYATDRPRQVPSVVDMIVTEITAGDDQRLMQLEVDGQPLSFSGRLRSRRSYVSTMPLDDFVRLTNADTIVHQAFGTSLQFGRAQVAMLRSTAAKWSGR
jgi:hypothetical protein